MRARLFLLLSGLVAAGGLFAATSDWRHRLLEESARSRRVIAAVEQAKAAREERTARERGLTADLQSHPNLVEVRLELAQLRWAEAGPRAAAAVLQAAPASPAAPRLLRLLAAAQRLMGREDLALATLDRAVRIAPQDGNLQAERATLFSLMGWFAPAEQALRSAITHHADPLPVALVRVTMARQRGDLRTARRDLEAVERRFPDDPEVLKQLAAVAEGEGQIAEAKQRLEAAAKTDADPDVWVALARLELRPSGAKDENAGNTGPVSPEAVARARADLQRALALRPELPSARLLMARCQRLSGETAEARAILERLHRERPGQEAVAFELSQLYRDLGLTDQFRPLMALYQASMQRREEMRRAAVVVMAHPDSAAAHREMGRLCLQRGMIGRAILSLQRAMSLDPGLPGVREALAAAHRAAESRDSPAASDPSDPSDPSRGALRG